ncbi:MAG: hypothetical protein WCI51_20715 [Lentisphaerota bacterium]
MNSIEADIIKAVDKLYGASCLPVKPEDIYEIVCDKIGIDSFGFEPCIIENALEGDRNYVMVSGGDDGDDYFFSRRGLFDKAQFCIRPTAMEIEQGILIPGHRFIPFFDRDSAVRLETAGNKPAKIKKIKSTFNFSSLGIYYSLLGLKGMMERLTDENQDNMFALMKNMKQDEDGREPGVEVSVYNFKDFYAANKIVEGDLLLLSIVDYKKKVCTVERLPDERLWQAAKWDSTFAQGMRLNIDMVDQGGQMEPIEVFLSRAFFLADHGLLQAPSSLAVNILKGKGFYLAASDSGGVLIWEKDRKFDLLERSEFCYDDDYDDDDDDDDDFMPEDDSAFNQLCKAMNFSINDEELAGYMRDELFSGGKNLDNVKKRCFDNRVKQFYPDLQQMFDEEILEIWKSVTAEYNIFRDNPQGKIRKKALELLDVHMAWMRKLDANNIAPDRVLEKNLIELMQIVGPVSGVVEFLNEEQKLSQKEVNNYCEMLDMAMTTHAGMLKKINKTLGM